MYVNNSNHIRKDLHKIFEATPEQLKSAAERRMAIYDKLPKAAREAVNEYGQLRATTKVASRRADLKIKAIRMAYVSKLERTSTLIKD